MQTIGEKRQLMFFAPKGAHSVGVEVEIENANIPALHKKFDLWKITQDDSLRNGQELVTALPVWKANLEEMFEQFDAIIKTAKGEPDASWRCSTHVHLDVRDCTNSQLQAIMAAVCLTDTLVIKANGREGSNFCVPYRSAHPVHQAFQKYSSAGLFRLKDLGTIEFRMFSGCTRSSELRRIVDVVHAYRAVADREAELRSAILGGSIANIREELRDVLLGLDIPESEILDELRKGYAATVVLLKSEALLSKSIKSLSNFSGE